MVSYMRSHSCPVGDRLMEAWPPIYFCVCSEKFGLSFTTTHLSLLFHDDALDSFRIHCVAVVGFSICRLPRPSGPLPRIPSHCQGSESSLGPWRPACLCVCGQRVVPLPKQLPSATQVSVLQWQWLHCSAFPPCWFTNWLDYFISSWQLHFIQSEFKGQLPQPYASGPLPTQIIPAHMNDQNLEEPTRYVSLRQCCRGIYHQVFHYCNTTTFLGEYITRLLWKVIRLLITW